MFDSAAVEEPTQAIRVKVRVAEASDFDYDCYFTHLVSPEEAARLVNSRNSDGILFQIVD